MELRQLEYFREIASTGSINEAAKTLKYVPAAAQLSDPPAGK